MCDCLWFGMGVCEGNCFAGCKNKLSMNSDKSQILMDAWSSKTTEILKAPAKQFAIENGFSEVNNGK